MTDEEMKVVLQKYSRLVVPDDESGFSATIREFPGCIAEGETEVEALANLQAVAESWLEGAIEEGMPIPPPLGAAGLPSGRIALRVSRSLHQRAIEYAEAEGVSLNTYLNTAIAEKLGLEEATKRLRELQAEFAAERKKLDQSARRLAELLRVWSTSTSSEHIGPGVVQLISFGRLKYQGISDVGWSAGSLHMSHSVFTEGTVGTGVATVPGPAWAS